MESFLEEEREDVDDDDDDEKKKKTVWQDSLAAVEEMHNMYNGKLTEKKGYDFGSRNGRSLGEGMEEVDLNESATEDKVEETEREKGKGKPKKAGV